VIKKFLKMLTNFLGILAVLAVVLLILPRIYTQLYARARIHTTEQSPTARVAIVFGAGLRRDGSPTPVLQDRVTAAAKLYQEKKVQKLLMSGDNRFLDYNEPGAMYDYAIKLGIPPEDIILDYAGRRTYDTCYRAIHIFKVTDAVLVTQDFHLPRALFTCNGLGLPAEGVSADMRTYSRFSETSWLMREMPATLVALMDVWVTHPLPVLGDPEPIFPEDMARTP
jgi:SanA protein